jgi:hypothetical protein
MRRPLAARAAALAALLAVFAAAPLIASPNAPTPSSDLVEKAKALDGTMVVFEGEAIGEPMRRGDHAWINASDGNYGIGIWLPASEIAKVGRFGSYAGKGDRIRVEGVFHRACPEHGGDLDIHADSLEVVERGSAAERRPGDSEIAWAAALLASGLVLLALWRRKEQGIRPAGRPSN